MAKPRRPDALDSLFTVRWGLSPIDGHWIPFDGDTGEPLFCGDRLQLGWDSDGKLEATDNG